VLNAYIIKLLYWNYLSVWLYNCTVLKNTLCVFVHKEISLAVFAHDHKSANIHICIFNNWWSIKYFTLASIFMSCNQSNQFGDEIHKIVVIYYPSKIHFIWYLKFFQLYFECIKGLLRYFMGKLLFEKGICSTIGGECVKGIISLYFNVCAYSLFSD